MKPILFLSALLLSPLAALIGDCIILRTASRLYSIRDSSAKPR